MDLRQLRYFVTVARERNFTRAAEALHVSQPTLSQQIKQLEDALGAPLFDRSGRAVRLTDAGEAWMRYARLALQDLDAGARAIHDVATLARGHLRLAMTPTFTAYLVGPTIDAFYRRYPGITLSIEEMAQERIEALLAQDRLDLGIAFEMAQSAEVEATPLFSETLELMVGADHPLAAHRRPLRLAEWQHLPLALLSGDFATRQFIDRYCTQQGFRPQVAVEANALHGGRLSVRDSGPGIADADSARLFEPFFSTKSDGMGLGLSICRSIITKHGGQIGARSTLSSSWARATATSRL